MQDQKKLLYSEELLEITEPFLVKIKEIKQKLSSDQLVNQGLFLMVTALFEDTIRALLRTVLLTFPDKLNRKTFTIPRKQFSEIAEKGYSVIIDNELYNMFHSGVQEQLEELQKVLFNKSKSHEDQKLPKRQIDEKVEESIRKISEISLFRNVLIHNAGKSNRTLENIKFFKLKVQKVIDFNKNLVETFIKEYELFVLKVNDDIHLTFRSFKNVSTVDKTRILWNQCFSSPIMYFDDFWEINTEKDLIVRVKYPFIESQLSRSEQILLSIWRHQFSDNLRTEEFLLCSIDYHKIYQLYKGLDEIKFYHMQQKSQLDM